MRLALALVLVAACSSSPLSGTLAYIGSNGDARVLDLATGADNLLEHGAFGGVSIAPDGQHIAYSGTATSCYVPTGLHVADRAGNITQLPAETCSTLAIWRAPQAFTYWDGSAFTLVPSLAASAASAARTIAGTDSVVSADGQTFVYVDADGDVILENGDASEHRVLRAATDPTHGLTAAGFTPDSTAVLVFDTACPLMGGCPTVLHLIRLADGASTDITDAQLSTWDIEGASAWNSSGSELVVGATTGIVAITPATGARRTIAAALAGATPVGAVFLDDQHVLWVSQANAEDPVASLYVAGPSADDDVMLGPTGNAIDEPRVLASGLLALHTGFVDRAGNVVTSVPQDATGTNINTILGATTDGTAMIALTDEVSSTGEYYRAVRAYTVDGGDELLAVPNDGINFLPPLAAYSPN